MGGVFLVGIAGALGLAGALDRIRVEDGVLKDAAGRARVFHGVNVVYKAPPWHPRIDAFSSNDSLVEEDMAQLAAWGFNVVRLGVMWPGVEPERGSYDRTYLATMRGIVARLAARGIYTIVDFHQDAFSQEYCGEGFPAWVADALEPVATSCDETWLAEFGRLIGQCAPIASYNFTTDPATGFPDTDECLARDFTMYSRAPEVTSSWGKVFANASGVAEALVAYWAVVAETFAGVEGVLGYDLVNEPLNGDFFEDATLLEPGAADRRLLEPLYARMAAAIRARDADAILFFEPTPYPSNIPVLGGVHAAGFAEAPGGNAALSYHIYSCGFAATDCDRNGDVPGVDCDACDAFAEAAGATRSSDARRLGAAAFLTEFGACSGSASCLAEISRVADVADAHLHSWAYWQFKYFRDVTTVSGPAESFYDADGALQDAKVAALRRTYASAVAGAPASMRYGAGGAFRLRYAAAGGLTTEVVLDGAGPRVVSVANATFVSDGARLTVAAGAGAAVDVAVARSSTAPTVGAYSFGDGLVRWTRRNGTAGFSLASNGTGWKGCYVKDDAGATTCALTTDGPAACDALDAHGLLFDYTIELWRAELLGIHAKVATIPASYFGPLLKERVEFEWEDA
ncbi:cellulase [Aureococcus anophagefferens]|uniref:Cellulase n=1 Tax=Aureococcus anophagefferens TaxID=44056 RepID=A0ABR1FH09_AURAN